MFHLLACAPAATCGPGMHPGVTECVVDEAADLAGADSAGETGADSGADTDSAGETGADSGGDTDSGGSVAVPDLLPGGRWAGAGSVLDASIELYLSGYDSDFAGASLAVGDREGDGQDDLLIGGPLGAAGGALFLPRGPILADLDLMGVDDDLPALPSSYGPNWIGHAIGAEVAFVGDVDGDGVNEVAVAAPSGYRDSTSYGIGDVFVFGGSTTVDWHGVGTSDGVGMGLSGGVDLTADGVPDLVVGAPFGFDQGDVYVLGPSILAGGSIGSADVLMYQTAAGSSRFGASVFQAGDVNGDGFPDLAVGWPGCVERGAASAIAIYAGPLTTFWIADGEDALIESSVPGVGAVQGASVNVGDADGDGIEDLLLGSREAGVDGISGAGRAFLISGASAAVGTSADSAVATFSGEAAGDQLGSSVARLGDIDGDGAVDVVIGAPGTLGDGVVGGQVCLWYGPLVGGHTCGDSDASWYGTYEGGLFGYALVAGHDLTGDGYGDIVVGEPGSPGPDRAAGTTYILPGFAPGEP